MELGNASYMLAAAAGATPPARTPSSAGPDAEQVSARGKPPLPRPPLAAHAPAPTPTCSFVGTPATSARWSTLDGTEAAPPSLLPPTSVPPHSHVTNIQLTTDSTALTSPQSSGTSRDVWAGVAAADSFMQRFLTEAFENQRQRQEHKLHQLQQLQQLQQLRDPNRLPVPPASLQQQQQQQQQPSAMAPIKQQQPPTPPRAYAAPSPSALDSKPVVAMPPPVPVPAPAPADIFAAARGTPEYTLLETALAQARLQGREAEFWSILHAQISGASFPAVAATTTALPATTTTALPTTMAPSLPATSSALFASLQPAPMALTLPPQPATSTPSTGQQCPPVSQYVSTRPTMLAQAQQLLQQQRQQQRPPQPPQPRPPPFGALAPQQQDRKPPAPSSLPQPSGPEGLRLVPQLWQRLSQPSEKLESSVWGAHGFCHVHLLPEPQDDGRLVGCYTRDERRARVHRYWQKRIRMTMAGGSLMRRYQRRRDVATSRLRIGGRFVSREEQERMLRERRAAAAGGGQDEGDEEDDMGDEEEEARHEDVREDLEPSSSSGAARPGLWFLAALAAVEVAQQQKQRELAPISAMLRALGASPLPPAQQRDGSSQCSPSSHAAEGKVFVKPEAQDAAATSGPYNGPYGSGPGAGLHWSGSVAAPGTRSGGGSSSASIGESDSTTTVDWSRAAGRRSSPLDD